MQRHPIGLVGWGVVGGGVVEILARDRRLFLDRCGIDLQLKTIVVARPERKRAQDPGDALVTNKLATILTDHEIKTVIHLVPGTTDARDICLALLNAGKHVVTANKALLAEHGDELFAIAAQRGVCIAFEAAVAGGVPVIAGLRDGLVANRIETICAILNGTCNFILTKMEDDRKSYADALAEAKQLGYAEADPTLDVNGHDTAHKLALLARIAFLVRVPVLDIRCQGIQEITAQDIASARTMGSRIKLLAVAQARPEGLTLSVAPTLVPIGHPLASVSRNYNGVYIVGDASGPMLFVGQGAGALPTASSILADVMSLAAGSYQATAKAFQFFSPERQWTLVTKQREISARYARFVVPDRAGILAGITNSLSANGVSILSIHQGAPGGDGRATIEVITHPLDALHFASAIASIDASGLTLEATVSYRSL